jgi:hypothetical protein
MLKSKKGVSMIVRVLNFVFVIVLLSTSGVMADVFSKPPINATERLSDSRTLIDQEQSHDQKKKKI